LLMTGKRTFSEPLLGAVATHFWVATAPFWTLQDWPLRAQRQLRLGPSSNELSKLIAMLQIPIAIRG
jgi:hypothetical protein